MTKKSVKIKPTKRQYQLLLTSLVLYVLYYVFAGEFWSVINLSFNSISYATSFFLVFVPLFVISILPSYVLMKLLYLRVSEYIADRALFCLIYIAISVLSIAAFMRWPW